MRSKVAYIRLAIWALAATVAASAASGAPTTQPATAPQAGVKILPKYRPVPVPRTDDLNQQIARRIGQLVEVLRVADDPNAPKAAGTQIVAIEKAYLKALLAYIDDDDPEVRLRVRQLLDRIATDIRVRRTLAKLPADQRTKLRLLRRQHPEIFRDVFSQELDRRVAAMKAIADMKDPKAIAEPLIVLCLNHPAQALVAAAAEATTTGRYRSDAVVDALCRVLARARANDWSRIAEGKPLWSAIRAIQAINSPRSTPQLLWLLQDKKFPNMYRLRVLTDMLIATGDKRLIPALIPLLYNKTTIACIGFDVQRVTVAYSDFALFILVRLTHQSPTRYKLITAQLSHAGIVGFTKLADRKAAIDAFMKWWQKNKQKEPYRGLKPIKPFSPLHPAPSSAKKPNKPTTAPATTIYPSHMNKL